MIINQIWFFKIIFGAFSAFFAFCAACFTFWEIYQHDKQESIQIWFSHLWEIINNNKLSKLPEIIICWFLNTKKMIPALLEWLLEDRWAVKALSLLLPVLVSLPALYLWNSNYATLMFVLSLPLFFLFLTDTAYFPKKGLKRTIYTLYAGSLFTFLAYEILLLTVNTKIVYSFIITTMLLPVFWVSIWGPFIILLGFFNLDPENINQELISIITFSISISFSITFLAIIIGKILNSNSPVPQTMQMLISNAIFDGITIFITLSLLEWSVKKNPLFRIPVALVLDIFLAGLLACFSLYFALLHTNNAINFRQALRVLFAVSPVSNSIEFGAYFWAMHTTFIPTIIYSLLIICSWVAKIILCFFEWFFGAGKTNKNPLKLTAALLTIFSILFAGLSYGVGVYEEYMEKYNNRPNNGMQLTPSSSVFQVTSPCYSSSQLCITLVGNIAWVS